jgi:membrane associated rhomboid family serine protease
VPRFPRWKEIPDYPVILGIAVLATGVTIAWWKGANISPLFESAEIRRGQLWRFATSVLPHLDILHLAFNLYWLWALGTTVERVYGHFRTLLIILLLATGSGSLDFAFAQGGVGLSGVGYGLFGLLYVLSQHDERFKDSLDKRTINLFVGRFFVCIFTTVVHVFNVANVAHAAGAVLGLLLGYAIVLPVRRSQIAASIGLLLLLGFAGATFGRPFINLSSQGGYEEAHWGYDALIANRNQDAIRWCGDAVKYQPKVSSFWFNLGIAYQRSNDQAAASAAYQRAYDLEPTILSMLKRLEKKPGQSNASLPSFALPGKRICSTFFFNRPTIHRAWQLRPNDGPGLESKGSSLPIPKSASLPMRFLLFGATIPSWPIRQMGLQTQRVVRRPRHEAFESHAKLPS